MRSTASIVLALALTACSTPDSGPATAPLHPATTPATTPPAPARTFVEPGSPLVQDLWRSLDRLGTLRSVLPSHLDVEQAVGAPRLHEAPIRRAVLAAGTSTQDYATGEVALLTSDGRWRVVDRGVLGMREPAFVEQQFRLSPDGRRLALGDELGIVFVRLATNEVVRVATSLRDPVIHRWTPDGRGVVVTARGSTRQRTWEVRPGNRTFVPVDLRPWSSSIDPEGRVIEFLPDPSAPSRSNRGGFDTVRTTDADGVEASSVALQFTLPPDTRIGRRSSTLVGVAQGGYRGSRGWARGVGAVDPATGRVVAFLGLPRAEVLWFGGSDLVLDGRWLVLQAGTRHGGGFIAWNPTTARLRLLMSTSGTAVTFAEGRWTTRSTRAPMAVSPTR